MAFQSGCLKSTIVEKKALAGLQKAAAAAAAQCCCWLPVKSSSATFACTTLCCLSPCNAGSIVEEASGCLFIVCDTMLSCSLLSLLSL
jgi:hypothetical protein